MIPYLVQQNREGGVIPECFYQESGELYCVSLPIDSCLKIAGMTTALSR